MSGNKGIGGVENQTQSSVEHSEVTRGQQLAKYPTLARFAADSVSLSRWLDVLAEGQIAGQIRLVIYNDAKQVVSRAVETAWKGVIGPYVYNGAWKQLPREVYDIYAEINVFGVHHLWAAAKRVAKAKPSHPMFDDMRALLAEFLPLAEAIKDLKGKVVKGRAPSTGPSKPENPNKLVKTCPCCFRPIAVVRGKMAHHGYERPGHGNQTASCWGIRFPPLEVSNEGLVWMIGEFERQLRLADKTWRHRNKIAEITTLNLARTKLVTVTRDMPEWDRTYDAWLYDLERQRRGLRSNIATARERLDAWKPETPAL
jgi:hypothetical protein